MMNGILGLMLVYGFTVAGAEELRSIFSSRTLQQLREQKISQQRSAVIRLACRLQLRQKMIPTACLKELNPSQTAHACQRIEPQQVSSAEIQRALQLKGWNKNCRKNLQQLQKRKFYQEQDPTLGVSFESAYPNGTSSASNTFLL